MNTNKMRTHYILLTLCFVIVLVNGSTVSNVRLVGFEEYMVSLITETMRKVEEMEWCNLRVNDVHLDLDENVLGTDVLGRVEYINGFVVSVQWVDIPSTSVKQNWRFDRAANTTRAEVDGALRLHAVTIGFDVLANMADGHERYTATVTHPLLQFDFTVFKDMFLDEITLRVVPVISRTTNAPRFLPLTNNSEVYAAVFDWNSITGSIRSWADDLLHPIALELALNEIQFPRICYNCPITSR